jgi:transmembrane sensor
MTMYMERTEEGTPSSIREHAAEWFLRLHAHDLNVAERFAYLQWLKASPVHIGETLQICRLYSVLYPMKEQLFFTNEDDVTNVIDLPIREAAAAPARTRSGWYVRMLTVVVAIGLLLFAATMAQRAWLVPSIETRASEWRSLTLDDGSFVSVGPRTQLRDQFGERQRLLRLSRGEALFQVAKDPSRPFIVDAGRAVVRATGTRFAVSRGDRDVVVTVEEGTVLVSNGVAGSRAVTLAAAEQVTVSSVWPPAVEHVNAARELAWSDRRLVFEGDTDTVAEAVEEFNRRNRVQIMVDARLGSGQVRGVFNADDPVSFAEWLAVARKDISVRQSGDVIRLQLQSAPQPQPVATPNPAPP